ncbi:MAG: hypothetical protein JNK63_06795 [Chthonomonas sp.]|nr:hypothetical protein [Chthonomonas sp.]
MSVLRGTVYLSISRLATLLLNVWAVGRFVEWLGNENWGGIALMVILWAICQTICDLGMTGATVNSMIKAISEKNQLTASRLLATHTAISCYLCALLVLIYAAAFQFGYVRSVGHGLDAMAFYAAAALTGMLVLINNGQYAALVSHGRYSFIALTATISAFLNTALSLWLIYAFRQPWGFWVGSFAGMLYVTIANEFKIRKLGFGSPRVGFFWKEFEDVKAFVKRSSLSNSATIATGFDRIVLSRVVSQAGLGIYDQSVRIPETLKSTMPIAHVFPAEIARVNLVGQEALQTAYRKLSSATMALAMAVLFIPSACGESYIRLIYPAYDPVMTILFALASIDASFALYGSLFASFSTATARPHLTAPFMWFMLLGTAFLAVPAALKFGLVGIAAARIVLQLVQFYPLEWAAKKYLIPNLELAEVVTKKAFIVLFASIFWVIGFRLIHVLGWQQNAIAGIGISSVLSYLYMACLYGFGAIWLPSRLARVLPRFIQKLAWRPD